MAQRLPVLYNKKPCYDIVFQKSFDGLWEELEELGAAEKKLCIVTDSTVNELYGAQVAELLEGKCRKIVKYAFPAGEENKNLETVKDVYRFLIEEGRFRLLCWRRWTVPSAARLAWILTAIRTWSALSKCPDWYI